MIDLNLDIHACTVLPGVFVYSRFAASLDDDRYGDMRHDLISHVLLMGRQYDQVVLNSPEIIDEVDVD
jgi:hypothetical protein